MSCWSKFRVPLCCHSQKIKEKERTFLTSATGAVRLKRTTRSNSSTGYRSNPTGGTPTNPDLRMSGVFLIQEAKGIGLNQHWR